MLEPRYHSIANRAFRPIGKKLKEDLKANFIFIALQPEKWGVSYFGTLPDQKLNDSQSKLRDRIEQLPLNQPQKTIWNPDHLHTCIRGLSNPRRRQQDCLDYLAAAQSILSSQSVALGNTQLQDEATRTPWCLLSEPRPFKLFQTALEMPKYRNSISSDSGTTDPDGIIFNRLGSHRTILEVDGYLKRTGIIDRKTAPAFIAEYLTALDGDISRCRTVDPAKVRHLFLPLSGLGQWRATASWFQTERNEQVDEYFHRSELTAMDELYTYAIIDSFIGNMSSEILHASIYKRGAFIRAFSELFWSLEIAAYHRNEICEVLMRNESGELEMFDTNNCPAPRATCCAWESNALEFIELHKDGASCFTNVQINLLALSRPGDSDILNEHVIRKFLGFDTVVLRAPFIEVEDTDIRRYSEYLRERLKSLLELQIARAGALEREGMSAMSHFSKGWINATDHLAAVDSLRASGLTEEPAVAKAIASLEMFQNVIAVNELIRLWTIDSDQDLSKIKNWVSGSLIEEFQAKPQEVVPRYSQFLMDAAMTILYGLGYKEEFRFVGVDDCGQAFNSNVLANHGPMSNMESWIRENGAVAPFSASDGPASHLVLLALIAEPIFNAVKELRRGLPEFSLPHISITFAKKDRETLLIAVDNVVCKRPPKTIPSLERIDEIYRQVELAEISYKTTEESDGTLAFSVKIDLTPIRFAERILASQPAQL